ncbi:MAG: hypothetical protein LIP12_01255 [Clostridiales bacterium]|nr:hypothetical protein [Clostridiales bacterium]
MKISVVSNFKKALLGMLLCITAVLVLGKTNASAASAPKCVSKQTIYYEANPDDLADISPISSYVYIKNLSSSAKIKNIKISNSAFTATKVTGLNAIAISLNEDSMGSMISELPTKAKLTFTVKQNGKSYSLSCALTFKKNPTVVKKITLGSKNYTSALKSHWFIYANKPSGSTAKLSVTMASGYTLKSIDVTYTTGKSITVKNGAKISLKNLSNITLLYKVKTKPTYYKSPTSSYITYNLPSPLYDYIWINF